jgi:biopolymer transport protein ExbB
MIAIITKGGIIVYLIIAASIFALSSFLERLIRLKSFKINTDKFLIEIEKLVKDEKLKEAIALCDSYNSPITRIVKAGLSHVTISRDRMTARLEEAALLEFPLLEAQLGVLATVAHISPLLGLLGTVNGMIKAFQVIQEKASATGLATPADLAQGIWMALITTALGLAVAIPTVVAYNYIFHQVQGIKHDMEKAATKVLSWYS